MAVHHLGGKDIQVDTTDYSFPISIFYRQPGITIQVNPSTHWYCLWLCSSTDTIDAIACDIQLSGPSVSPGEGQGSCRNCGDLTVRGPSWGGFRVPNPYTSVSYKGTVKIDGATYAFDGLLNFS